MRKDRQIGATIICAFAWFAAVIPLGFDLGLFFSPPAAVFVVVFAFLVAASVWLVWRVPVVAAGWFLIWAVAVVLRSYSVLMAPAAIACVTFLAAAWFAFEASRQRKEIRTRN